VVLSRNGAVAHVELQHAAKKNALSGKMMAEFEVAVSQLERASDVTVVVLKGQGDFFCSGADLSASSLFAPSQLTRTRATRCALTGMVAGEMARRLSCAPLTRKTREKAAPHEGKEMCAFMQEVTTRFTRLPCVSVGVIVGGAVGGGTELTTACDHRIFAQGAKWHAVQPRLGISTIWGGGARLVRLVGRSRALRLLAGSEAIDADEALRIGLADAVVPREDVDKRVAEFVAG